MVPGIYMFVAFGFTILLGILSNIYLQTPLELGGYGFTPYQNAACESPHGCASRNVVI